MKTHNVVLLFKNYFSSRIHISRILLIGLRYFYYKVRTICMRHKNFTETEKIMRNENFMQFKKSSLNVALMVSTENLMKCRIDV